MVTYHLGLYHHQISSPRLPVVCPSMPIIQALQDGLCLSPTWSKIKQTWSSPNRTCVPHSKRLLLPFPELCAIWSLSQILIIVNLSGPGHLVDRMAKTTSLPQIRHRQLLLSYHQPPIQQQSPSWEKRFTFAEGRARP